MKTLLLCLGILLLAAPVALADDIPACACTGKSIGRRFDTAAAVFTGTVREIAPVVDVTKKSGGRWARQAAQADRAVRVELSVDTVFKGRINKKKTFTLHTSMTEYTCAGYPFRKGEGYLVYAYRHEAGREDSTSLYNYAVGTFEVGGLCGGTREIAKAAEELNLLTAALEAKKKDGR